MFLNCVPTQIICIGLSSVRSKPLAVDESTANTNIDDITAANGHHFGDKLDWFNPTTPRDAANQYSLSYLETAFPEMPSQTDPKYDPKDHAPPERVYRSQRNAPTTPSPALAASNNANTQFFQQVYDIVRPNRNATKNASSPVDSSRSDISNSDTTSTQPTIALNKFVSAVEHTLVNVAQTLTNATDLNKGMAVADTMSGKRPKRDVDSIGETTTGATISLRSLINGVQNTLVGVAQTLANSTTVKPSAIKQDVSTVVTDISTSTETATISSRALNKLINSVGSSLTNASKSATNDSNVRTVAATSPSVSRETRDILPSSSSASTSKSPKNFEVVEPIFALHNIAMLSPMAVKPMQVNAPTTNTSASSDLHVIQSINKTKSVSTGNSVHVQHDKISLLTGAPGILPGVPAFSLDKMISVRSAGDNEDCTSDSSEETASDLLAPRTRICVKKQTSMPNGNGWPTAESTTVDRLRPTTVTVDSSSSSTTVKPTTASEKLTEKLAAVDAKPVRLTQGI